MGSPQCCCTCLHWTSRWCGCGWGWSGCSWGLERLWGARLVVTAVAGRAHPRKLVCLMLAKPSPSTVAVAGHRPKPSLSTLAVADHQPKPSLFASAVASHQLNPPCQHRLWLAPWWLVRCHIVIAALASSPILLLALLAAHGSTWQYMAVHGSTPLLQPAPGPYLQLPASTCCPVQPVLALHRSLNTCSLTTVICLV